MKLSKIVESIANLEELRKQYVATINPAVLIEQDMVRYTFPFVYLDEPYDELYVGDEGGWHSDISYDAMRRADPATPILQRVLSVEASAKRYNMISEQYDEDEDFDEDLDDTGFYENDYENLLKLYGTGEEDYDDFEDEEEDLEFPDYAVGRIGIKFNKNIYQFRRYSKILSGYSIITFYDDAPHSETVVKAVYKITSSKKLPLDKTYLVYAGNAITLEEFSGGNKKVKGASEEQKKCAKLFQLLHRGVDNEGNRLDAKMKMAIKRQLQDLGCMNTEIVKNKWQKASENSNIVTPGQKWWAPTSEGKE